MESWHAPGSLYAPYQADAFRSQAPILDFRNMARLKTDLLEALGITINPPTNLVIEHLKEFSINYISIFHVVVLKSSDETQC